MRSLTVFPRLLRVASVLMAWRLDEIVETAHLFRPLKLVRPFFGTPRPDEIVGAGATPLHKRQQAVAATIPAPEDLKTPNEVPDETKGVKLHGYVKK